MTGNAEKRFLELFRSNPESFVVRKRVAEKPDEDGKRSGVYTTLSRQVSRADVAAHFAGKTCLVLKPELPDDPCLWAMIDHDTYAAERCQIIREDIQNLGLPLHPFPSKSGGLHSAIFFRTPQPAPQVRSLLAEFAEQLGECPDCEIFPKPVAPDKKPFGIAMPFFGERDEFESFAPVFYDAPLNGHAPQSGGLSDLPSYGVRLPNGVDFGELLRGKLECDVRHEAGGISYDYHGVSGQPCLIKGALHSTNKGNRRESRFLVKDGYVSHQCFHADCRGETEPKTRKALEAIGISFGSEFPRSLPQNSSPWPEPLAREAFHGLAGEVVRAIEPHSEADPAALTARMAAWAEGRWKVHLKDFFGGMRSSRVGTTQIANYVEKRQGEGASKSTINRELALLRRAFSIGFDAEPQKVSRVPKFHKFIVSEKGNERRGFVEEAQYRKLTEQAADLAARIHGTGLHLRIQKERTAWDALLPSRSA